MISYTILSREVDKYLSIYEIYLVYNIIIVISYCFVVEKWTSSRSLRMSPSESGRNSHHILRTRHCIEYCESQALINVKL